MDTQTAMNYLKSLHGESDSQPDETVKTESTAEATGEQAVTKEAPVPEVTEGSDRESQNTEPTETKVEEVPQPKKKPTKQEQIDYAFAREHKRYKKAQSDIEARDKRIAELEAKFAKYAPLEQIDFDPNDLRSYIDHRFALQREESELNSLKAERDREDAEVRRQGEMERHAKQVNDCFATDEERQSYWTLLRNGSDKFKDWLAENDDNDRTIDSFLGDSPIAPLMIATLMRNPNIREQIASERSAKRKENALYALERRLKLQQTLKSAGTHAAPQKVQPQSESQEPVPQAPKKRPLPIVGSLVQTPGSSGETTKRDWNRYLAENPRGT